MPTTYRYSIDVDDFRARYMMKPHLSYTVARRSKKSDSEAQAAFALALTHHCPQTNKASASLEVVSNRGHEVLLRVRGEVATTRIGRDGYCQVPATGRWLSVESGTVVATTR
jgi:hypothetical protein